ncbi:Bug family tripartite tricarboxylate transporter substrate binding protein [Muricoccus aerilatus]|uniref:Bug family tripartite tricarboxylate transporter substrate binding protein n=1 Tax=Muricoccus aerilatus TaxID=452982 RepID=UPI000A8862C0|nr:tripartite tricarboxylate transporter substrate binding protein [Roseomonas aerilata]
MRVIVPFTPGGSTDAMARVTAAKLSEKLGQPFVVENRPGANGAIGGRAVAEAAPDGYMLCFSASIQVLARQVMRNPGYDPVADLRPIVRTGRGPLLLLMNRSRLPNTLQELLSAVRSNPRDWPVAVSSLGAAGHLATIEFIRQAGVELVQVPYRGTAPAITDVVAGNVALVFEPILATWPPARDGLARALAITSATRSDAAPNVPTAAEGGMPNLDIQSWWGLWGPQALPAEIVARIGDALRTGMLEPDVFARVGTLGIVPMAEVGTDFAAFIRSDVERAETLFRLAKFQPE